MVRRRAVPIAGAVLFLTLASVTYQGITTAIERHGLPHPGRLVAAGDHQLHIHCTGDGPPTVVLEANVGLPSASWAHVQPAIPPRIRVCSYDRTGLGWSEAGDRPFDPRLVAEQLHTLLANAGERAPFIVVGQGTGGAYATIFAARYRADTQALVIVRGADPPRITAATPWLARLGVRRLLGGGEETGAVRTFLLRPGHLTRAAAEFAAKDDAVRLAAEAQPAAPPAIETPDDRAAIVRAIETAAASAGRD